MSESNLIVCANVNGEVNNLFKVSPENIVGNTPVPVSPYYEQFNFNKLSFVGSGEFTGPYYDDYGNNLGCKGVYVIGVYSATKGDEYITDKEFTLYLSDKQLSVLEDPSNENLLRQCETESVIFDDSYYTDKESLKSHLTDKFNKVTDGIKFSYTFTSHYSDTLTYVANSFNADNLTAKFKCSVKWRTYNDLFTGVPGYGLPLEKPVNYLGRSYDTALFSYDILDFGVTEIYPTGFAVGTNNIVAGDGAIATGMGSAAMGAFSAAFGRSSQARGYTAFAAGVRSKALFEFSMALGNESETHEIASVAIGNKCKAYGSNSFAAGSESRTNNDRSVALGNTCRTGSNSQCVVGKYNCKNSTATFAVGGGSHEGTVKSSTGETYNKFKGKNILEITDTGRIIVPVQGTNPTEFAYLEIWKNSDTGALELKYGLESESREKYFWHDSEGNELDVDPTK